MNPAARVEVLAFGVLPNADEVDAAVIEVSQRAPNTREKLDRPEVDEEFELSPEAELPAA